MTTIARHCMITVFTPLRISLLAAGIKTLKSNCGFVHPLIKPASTTSGEILFSPRIVFLIIGGVAMIIVAIEPAWSPSPNKAIIGTKYANWGIVCITFKTGCKAVSTFLSRYPQIPKERPRTKQIGVVINTNDNVWIDGT